MLSLKSKVDSLIVINSTTTDLSTKYASLINVVQLMQTTVNNLQQNSVDSVMLSK